MENDNWFAKEIGLGLAKLSALRLEGTPSSENMEFTTMAWLETLSDARRWKAEDMSLIRKTFSKIMQTAKRWVSPAQFLEFLPVNHQCHQELPALPNLSKDDKAKQVENIAKVKEQLRPLYEKISMDKHLKAKEKERKNQLAREHEARRKMDWATRIDLARMKSFCEAHAGVICPHTNQTCNIYLDLSNLILKVESDVQALENIENDVPAFIISEPEPTKKRRKKANV